MPTIRLQSSDGEIFNTDEQIAKSSGTIKILLEDCGIDGDETGVIPLPNINSTILRKVLEYVDHHKNDPVIPDCEESLENRTDDISPWDIKFLSVNQTTLFELILAANYLDTKGLMNAACKTVANLIKGKSADEIRKTFDTRNEYVYVNEVEENEVEDKKEVEEKKELKEKREEEMEVEEEREVEEEMEVVEEKKEMEEKRKWTLKRKWKM